MLRLNLTEQCPHFFPSIGIYKEYITFKYTQKQKKNGYY